MKLRRPPIEIIVRSAMDIWSVKETFLDQFYTRFGMPVEDGWTVMDIGAGIGEYCLYAAFGKPGVLVYAYEPFPESFELLRENLALNGIENVKAFQTAVWGKEGELHLDLTAGEPLQIRSLDESLGTRNNEGFFVNATTLQSAISAGEIERIDLLKMDCEGAEYEILFNTPHETLNRVERIIMEYHDADQEHSHPVLAAFLESQGYQISCHQNYVHEDIGYLFAVRA